MRLFIVRHVCPAGVLVAILATGGCRPPAGSTNPSPARSGKPGEVAIEPWLTVTADPAEVDAARAAAAAAVAKRYESIFAELRSAQFTDQETLDLIDHHRPNSVGRLVRALGQDQITDEAVGATLLLCRLREVAGRNYAVRILRDGTPEQRMRVLRRIDGVVYDDSQRKKYREFLLADPEFVTAALAQLDSGDEKIVKAAIQCCGFLRLPGANERFSTLLRKPNPPDPERLLYWLSKGEITQELFDYALAASNDAKLDDRLSKASIFEAAAASKSEPLRSQAKNQLRALLAALPDDGRAGFAGNRMIILSALSEAADKNDGDWLSALAESERGVYAVGPMKSYVRLFPEEGRQRLLQWIGDDQRREAAVQAAEACYARSADAELIRAIAGGLDTVDDGELRILCSALIAIGGKSVRETVERVASRLDPEIWAWYRRRLDPMTYAEIATAVRPSGVLSAAEIDTALAELAKPSDDSEEGNQATPDLFPFFQAARSGLAFDVETDMLPCRHDELVRKFAGGSRGRFQPEAVLEIWHQKNPDDDEAPYTLQFVVKDRLYRADLRNLGDWFDEERVVRMINESLAREAIDDRFMLLASSDQVAEFVFADPKRLIPLAEKFRMKLSDDAEEAMRKGKEFEERVFGEWKAQGK